MAEVSVSVTGVSRCVLLQGVCQMLASVRMYISIYVSIYLGVTTPDRYKLIMNQSQLGTEQLRNSDINNSELQISWTGQRRR
ncbi:hypothetical protein EB796_012809 [Bugula neritina]|uniref:Uncharacterized protein n=1 Tax=Bugula neritina TaxID=10212 RepID=A0A7J7JT91_BUGNE|nr:hypothetical protein EB796_012809 [Bugula neritina]